MAVAAAATVSSVHLLCRASWDTNPSPKPSKFSHSGKSPKPSSLPASQSPEMAATATATATATLPADELYLGYERWLPAAPKVKKPRSIYNAASLAYLGDGIYEALFVPPKSIDVYNERVMAIVRCEAQDALLKKLMNEDYLTEEERDILRWGKNIASGKTRTKKRAGMQVYSRASSLETLIGFLYLTDVKRLEDLMRRLGFSAGAPPRIMSWRRWGVNVPNDQPVADSLGAPWPCQSRQSRAPGGRSSPGGMPAGPGRCP
ncbi:unnamed protein product [Spirodela intermedia]|uniref:RNase III domain-containing protein n=1 Tax=Spirodela intermedia TaxID=51605 RepID=A0A7I8ISE9_SPIIN|nr:unnamed protein product [Spirodela intermedia]CAA6660920.1 unnamed protein product [Spirodela intermedia]